MTYHVSMTCLHLYIIQILCVCACVRACVCHCVCGVVWCVCVCVSSIGGQTAGPIRTKFGTHMRIDLGMVPT